MNGVIPIAYYTLLAISTGYYNGGTVTVIQPRLTQAQCMAAVNFLEYKKRVTTDFLCVPIRTTAEEK